MSLDSEATQAGEDRRELASPPIFQARELFRGNREVIIEHGGAQYRLRITKAGKLILNK